MAESISFLYGMFNHLISVSMHCFNNNGRYQSCINSVFKESTEVASVVAVIVGFPNFLVRPNGLPVTNHIF